MRYLILGSGPAGIAAARAARKKDPDAEVVIATEECTPPCLRPHLPDLVSGEKEEAAIADPQGKGLDSAGIKIAQGKRARRLDAAKNRVLFSDGTEEGYNFLLVATGGKPILPLPLMGSLGSFFTLNSQSDAVRIKARALRSDVSLVYGPGYLGLETSRALRKLGQQVIWLNPGLPRFGNPISGETEAKAVEKLRGNGVTVKEGTEIADLVDRDGKGYTAYTTGGERIECSMVVVATERFPSVAFLEGSGVKVGTGVLVDEYLRTNVSNVYAAGDCAEVFDVNRRESRINFGWRSAMKQGQLAGENLAGGEKLYIRNTEDYFGLLYGSSLLERIK